VDHPDGGSDVIRVLLVDDHAILREGLKALLRQFADIQIVGEAATGRDAVAAVGRHAPDVVVMDLEMPGDDGATTTREMSRLDPPPNVLILTMHTEEERLVPLLRDGARGYLSKDCTEHELVDAIRAVAAGDFFVRPAVTRLLASNAMPHATDAAGNDARRQLETLSARERTVLQRTAEGFSGVEIARMLSITSKTVDTYKTRIGEKLGFTHRTDYVRFALRLGLITDDGRQRFADEVPQLR
jgi:two-component system, NarL family, response regulator NreC